MSSSSSFSSSSSSSNGNNGRNYGARRGDGDDEGPSRTRRRRGVNEVWPEPFVEDLAAQVAIDAAHSFGRLAAAQVLSNFFLVCSTWRAVSRSDHLWERLTGSIWGRTNCLHQTWRDEYMYRQRTAFNFRNGRYSHYTLHFTDVHDPNDPNALVCRCLALSDLYLACGFADGTVRLFDLSTRLHVRTFHPEHRDLLGPFSRAVSGIIIRGNRLVFATLDGDIHVAIADAGDNPRRAHLGDVVNDGALVDFTGCGSWWVGLYAGVPGQAFHIWDGNTEQLRYVGGWLTDPEAVMGWYTLTEITDLIGRIRVTGEDSAVACTSSRRMVVDLRNEPGAVLEEEELRRGIVVGSFDVHNNAYVMVDNRGIASVRRVGTRELVCRRFNVAQGRVMGCMNGGFVVMCAGGLIRVWGTERGDSLYNFGEGVGDVNAMVADERHVAAAAVDTRIHLWDFGEEE